MSAEFPPPKSSNDGGVEPFLIKNYPVHIQYLSGGGIEDDDKPPTNLAVPSLFGTVLTTD
jgi:hypothetical protein